MEIRFFSRKYTVRTLSEDDIPAVYDLCSQNPQYYRYCPPSVSEESIRQDMTALPPGKDPADKYYIGYFDDEHLIAVMDFIDGFPDAETAFIGFFMVDHSIQGQGIGTEIIRDLCEYLAECGFAAMRLGWVRGNPQSEHFWHKCGFYETGVESKTEDYTIRIAQKRLKP